MPQIDKDKEIPNPLIYLGLNRVDIYHFSNGITKLSFMEVELAFRHKTCKKDCLREISIFSLN